MQVVPATAAGDGPASRLAATLLEFVGRIPASEANASPRPERAALARARVAAAKAAAAAGALAIPPGPAGWLTLVPEIVAVWRIQAQMVADIAAIHGRQAALTREQMLWCLFKHTASQAVRDLAVQMGERILVRRATLRALQAVAQRVGVDVTQRTIAKAASRWLPVVGPLGVGAYAYHDTMQVARSAISLFSHEVVVDEEAIVEADGEGAAKVVVVDDPAAPAPSA